LELERVFEEEIVKKHAVTMLFVLIAILIYIDIASAQTPMGIGATLPVQCSPFNGAMFFITTGVPQTIVGPYYCKTPNNWVKLADVGAGGLAGAGTTNQLATWTATTGVLAGLTVPLCGDTTHALGWNGSSVFYCQAITPTGGGGASMVDNMPFTAGADMVGPFGALYNNTPPAIASGNVGLPRMSATRVLLVDGSTATQPVSGTITANAGTGNFTVAQATAANLNATITGTLTGITNPITVNAHNVTNAGTFATQASQAGTWNIGTVTAVTAITNALPAGANNIGSVNVATMPPITYNSTQPTLTNGQTAADVQITNRGGLIVATGVDGFSVTNAGTFATQSTVTQPTAANLNATVVQATAANLNATVAQTGTWTMQPGNTANTTPWLMSIVPPTTGGASTCYLSSAASNNATNCKNAAGQVYQISGINTTGTLYYLRLYNLAAAPTCSSATGFIESYPVPASTTGAGLQMENSIGQAYSTGIGFCLTGGGGNTDNTNAAAGVYISIKYK